MRPIPKPRSLAIGVALLVWLGLGSCLDRAGAPGAPYVGRFAVAPTFVSGTAGIVQIAQVRVVLTRPADQSVALDTTVTVTPGAVEVDLSLTVPVFSSSEVFIMTVEFIKPDGMVAFEGGPVEVTTTTDPSVQPPPVELPVVYVGIGSDAQSVQILTTGATVRFGETVTLTAQALDASAQPIAGTPIGWSSLDLLRAVLPDEAVGQVVGGTERGIARIVATLLTGQTDIADVLVTAVPGGITLVSGDAQTGPVNLRLPVPIVVEVAGTDGPPLDGINVDLQAPAGGGSFTPASVVTDTAGRAQASWTLGPTSGAQTATATVTENPALAVTISATATVEVLANWTNPAGGNWSNGANWSTGAPPTASQTAVIDLAGPYTVNLDVPASVAGLNLGGATGIQTLAVLASPITFSTGTVGANGVVTISNAGSVGFTAAFDNAGTVNVQTGTLSLSGGSSASGAFTVVLGSTLQFSGGVHTLSAASSVMGDGRVEFTAGTTTVSGTYDVTGASTHIIGGTANFSSLTPSTTSNLTLSSGTLGGTGTVLVSGAMTWSGGTMTDAGITRVLAAGTLTLDGGLKLLRGGRLLENVGSATWTAGEISGGDGAILENRGSFQLMGDVLFSSAVGAPPIFDNVGTFVSTNLGTATLAGTFDNFGSVDVQSGTLALTGGGDHGASFTVAPLATLDFGGGIHTVSQTGPVNITGNLTVSGGTLDLGLNGNVVVSGDFSTTVAGVLKMDNTASLVVGGNASFGGGSTAGTLLGGLITVTGNFSQSGDPASFAPSAGTHTVLLNGTAQTISFASPGPTSSRFQDLQINNLLGAASLSTSVQVNGKLTVTATTLTGVGTLTVVGDVTVSAELFSMAELSVGGVLSVTATYSVTNTTFTGTGPQTIPVLAYTNVDVTGSAAFGAATTISGNLSVSGTGNLDVGGQPVTVSGTFSTAASGVLTMTNAAGMLDVSGNVTFGGGSTSGTLSAGTLKLQGNFSQVLGSSQSFAASGTHKTIFNGTLAQTINFSNPGGTSSRFQELEISNSSAGVQFETAAQIDGTIRIDATGPTVTSLTGVVVTAGGGIDEFFPGEAGSTNRWQVENSLFPNDSPLLPSQMTTNATFTGKATLSVFSTVNGNVTVTDNGDISITGSFSPSFSAKVFGDFSTQGNGTLTTGFSLNPANDNLTVSGNVTFAGGSTAGLLVDGTLSVGGNFTQSGNVESFHAGGTHTVDFNGTAAQTVTFTNPDIGVGVAASHFANIAFNGTGTVTLGSNVFAHSTLSSTLSFNPTIVGNGNRLVVGGLNVDGMTLNRVLLEWNGSPTPPFSGSFTKFDNVQFASYLTSDTQFTIVHPGAASAFTLGNLGNIILTALTTGDTGLYLDVTDSIADANTLTIDIFSTPANCIGDFTKVSGGATVNWNDC